MKAKVFLLYMILSTISFREVCGSDNNKTSTKDEEEEYVVDLSFIKNPCLYAQACFGFVGPFFGLGKKKAVNYEVVVSYANCSQLRKLWSEEYRTEVDRKLKEVRIYERKMGNKRREKLRVEDLNGMISQIHDKVIEEFTKKYAIENVTFYLPFPHYKGKPMKKFLKWMKTYWKVQKEDYQRELKENIERIQARIEYLKKWNLRATEDFSLCELHELRVMYKKMIELYNSMKFELVNTLYGKMLKLYISRFFPLYKYNEVKISVLPFTYKGKPTFPQVKYNYNLTKLAKNLTLYQKEKEIVEIVKKEEKESRRPIQSVCQLWGSCLFNSISEPGSTIYKIEEELRVPIYATFTGEGKFYLNFKLEFWETCYFFLETEVEKDYSCFIGPVEIDKNKKKGWFKVSMMRHKRTKEKLTEIEKKANEDNK